MMRRRSRCAGLALVLTLALTACGGGTRVTADLSAYGDTPITVTGLTEEDFTVTPSELAGLECTEATATGNSAKAGTVHPVGPTLETFLAAYGKEIADLERIRFYATDGYYVGFLPESLEKYEFILAVANGDDPLGNGELPLRVVVVGGDSGKWVRMIDRIECFCKE